SFKLPTHDVPQLALDPVPDDGVPDRLRDGETEAWSPDRLVTGEEVERQEPRRDGPPLAVNGVEVARARKTVPALHRRLLRRQALTALGAAPLQDLLTGTRRHAGAKAMLPLPPAHVRLISPLHDSSRKKGQADVWPAAGEYSRTNSRFGCPQAV